MIIKLKLIIHAMNIVMSLCSDHRTITNKPYNFAKGFKFTSNFESINLIEAYTTNDRAFNHMKCVLKSSKDSLAQAVSFEVGEDTSRICK